MKVIIMSLMALLLGCQEQRPVVVGYQLMANPWKHLIATGKLATVEGKKIEFKKFNSGAKVVAAMASGDIDMAMVGSTPLAAALSQGLDLKLLWVSSIIGEAEALVVKPEIQSLIDLKGKTIATPFGSTSHYHLLTALKSVGLSNSDLKVLNLTPSAISASWQKGDIDGAFVWSPALSELKKNGKVLISSANLAKQGSPTFDAFVGRSEFIQNERATAKALLRKVIDLHGDYNSSQWEAEGDKIKNIAKFVGITSQETLATLKGYLYPSKADHPTDKLPAILKETSRFLKEQNKISTVLESYADRVETRLISEL